MISRHDIAFMVQEIISECNSRPKGADMIDLIDKYSAKFGKDNSGMVDLDRELTKFFNDKFIRQIHEAGGENDIGTWTRYVYSLSPVSFVNYFINKFSQQPPKERQKIQPCGCVVCSCQDDAQCHGCGAKNCGTKECVFKFHPENIKYKQPPKDQYPCNDCGKLRSKAEGGTTFSVCDECWDKKYSKERKVRLEEIKQITKLYRRMSEDGYSGKFSCAEEAILSLLNATEERKGEE